MNIITCIYIQLAYAVKILKKIRQNVIYPHMPNSHGKMPVITTGQYFLHHHCLLPHICIVGNSSLILWRIYVPQIILFFNSPWGYMGIVLSQSYDLRSSETFSLFLFWLPKHQFYKCWRLFVRNKHMLHSCITQGDGLSVRYGVVDL